jgi:hypothetical protein
VIVDYPYIVDLARGVDRRIIQDGDVQVIVPAVITPVAIALAPTVIGLGTGVLANASATASSSFTRTNSAPLNQEILRLPAGLYTIELMLSARFNFTTIGAAGMDAFMRMINIPLVNTFNLVGLYAATGFNGSVTKDYKFLLQETYIFQANIGVTGVGQTVDMTASINAVRHL